MTKPLLSVMTVMRYRSLTVGLSIATLAIASLTVSPAFALDAGHSVQQIIQSQTGSPASLMTTPRKVGNVSVGVGSSVGSALESYTQTPDAKSTRVMSVISNTSQSVVTYPIISPAGVRVESQSDGSLKLVTEVSGPPSKPTRTIVSVTTISTPWAVDAAGRQLPTTYSFAGTVLTQRVNTTGATFPVVADPTVSFGWSIYIHLARWEVFKAYGSSSYNGMGVIACGMFATLGPIGDALGVVCGLYAYWMITNLGQGIYTAAHSVWNGPNACLTAEFSYPYQMVPLYQGYTLNYCTY